jgi:predicted DNA-binding transcriptional regulator AlpA
LIVALFFIPFELRLIVPLADSTIYQMELYGEFPRRFNLTPHCVVWDLEKVEAWLEQRRPEAHVSLLATSYQAGFL